MFTRIAMATALALVLGSPAFADCSQELKKLEPSVVTADTGASTNPSGMPATKHQEQVLSGKQNSGNQEVTGSTAGEVKPGSPHQEQVTGKRSAQSAEHASQVMADARKMAQAGDEQGCMKKVADLKHLLGVK